MILKDGMLVLLLLHSAKELYLIYSICCSGFLCRCASNMLLSTRRASLRTKLSNKSPCPPLKSDVEVVENCDKDNLVLCAIAEILMCISGWQII